MLNQQGATELENLVNQKQREASGILRSSGKFTFLNYKNAPISVIYCGTTHKREPYSGEPSASELDFIHSSLDFGDKAPLVLVEQGSPSLTENHIIPYLEEITKGLPIRDRFYKAKKMLMPRLENNEFAETFKKHPSIRSLNIDLKANPEGFKYIFERLGVKGLVEFVCISLMDYFDGFQYNAQEIILSLIPKLGFTISEDDIMMAYKQFEPIYSNQENISLYFIQQLDTLDRMRNEFMMRQLLKQDKPVQLLAHSAHIAGIITLLQKRII
jgi:hypothetical protein